MPSKGARAAARQKQAQERNKKRRGNERGRGQEFDPGPSESRTVVTAIEPVLQEESGETAVPASATQTAASAQARPRRRSRQRAGQSSEPLVYRYMGKELRQIGIISVLMGAILAALTFILGG